MNCLASYDFPGDDIAYRYAGSALAAVEGRDEEIGKAIYHWN